ncbi:hypothetical protein FVE85_6267 [Porphyridium purpureum]|uniref:Uncharacterized protein n=1 Tax=Porphyridium purpureum TaxID=35688 RepID=A0A5J4Z6G2_PORPP|nr:hypothetical protein FVE85_6267 [Porphyridium purpureum]|eukprot:POR6740..scf295_1
MGDAVELVGHLEAGNAMLESVGIKRNRTKSSSVRHEEPMRIKPLLLYGEPGLGKSVAVLWLLEKKEMRDRRVVRIDLSSGVDLMDAEAARLIRNQVTSATGKSDSKLCIVLDCTWHSCVVVKSDQAGALVSLISSAILPESDDEQKVFLEDSVVIVVVDTPACFPLEEAKFYFREYGMREIGDLNNFSLIPFFHLRSAEIEQVLTAVCKQRNVEPQQVVENRNARLIGAGSPGKIIETYFKFQELESAGFAPVVWNFASEVCIGVYDRQKGTERRSLTLLDILLTSKTLAKSNEDLWLLQAMEDKAMALFSFKRIEMKETVPSGDLSDSGRLAKEKFEDTVAQLLLAYSQARESFELNNKSGGMRPPADLVWSQLLLQVSGFVSSRRRKGDRAKFFQF